jgi:hypothetical protein
MLRRAVWILALLATFDTVAVADANTGRTRLRAGSNGDNCTDERVIPGFDATRTGGVFTLTWGNPAGIANPQYEVVAATSAAGYCAAIQQSATVVAKVAGNTYNLNVATPNVAYRVFVRLADNPCVSTEFAFVLDTFTVPPQKPAPPKASVSGNTVNLSFVYSDVQVFAVRLERAGSDGVFTTIDLREVCEADRSFTDAPPAGVYQYRLLVRNFAATVVSDPVSVAVGIPVRIISFSATPTQIRAGQSATLSFVTEAGTSVFINNGVGSLPASGTVTVTPSVTTTYTLTAVSGQTTVTSSVTIQVITEPSVNVSLFPAALIQATGASGATSSYTVTNSGGSATTVTVGQSGNFFTQSPTSFNLAPGASQIVTVTATAQPAGTFNGAATLSGNGVPAGLQVPIRLLTATPPNAPVVAKAIDNRVDVSGAANVNPSGSVRFSNAGPGTLIGTVVADVPWLIPASSIVTIPPGGTVSVGFTIDRSKRSDSDSLLGSTTGTLGLYYIANNNAGKGRVEGNQGGAGTPPINITKASVVDTVPPSTGTGAPPALAAGEVALFVAGLGHAQGSVGLFISDLSILNPLSTRSIDDIRFFYTPLAGSLGESRTANVQLASARSLTVGDAVKTAFGQENLGTLQIRSRDADKLNVNATVFNSSNPAGSYGTAIPTIRSDRSVGSGGSVVLTGLRQDASAHTNLYIQEVSGTGVSVQTEFIAANGSTVSTRSDDLGAFALKALGSVVPANAVSAILTPTTTGSRFQAFATPVDEASGDTWTVADWSSFYGYAPTETAVIPVAGVLAGAGNTFFRTDAAIMNRGTGTASGTLRYFGRSGETPSRTVTLGSRQSMIVSDIIGSFFGSANGSVGFVTFTPTTGSFSVTSRTYTTVAGQVATFGTGAPTIAASGAIRRGNVRAIASLEDSALSTVIAQRPSTFRTNYGMLETSGNSVRVRVTVKFSFPAGPKTTGSSSASKDYDLAGNQFLLINGLTADVLGPARNSLGDLRNIEAAFQVIDGEGAVMVFTSSVDNGTGDTILRTD